MEKLIGVLNQKGGVGKTTTSVNLGAGLAEQGKKVLLIDVDAQSNLTAHLGLAGKEDDESMNETPDPQFTIYDVMKGKKHLKDVMIKRSDTLYVAPASLLLSASDLEFGGTVGRELILKRAIEPIKNDFDFVIFDCPPALGLLTLNVLAAVDNVIVPVQSEYLALHGVRQLLDTIDQVRSIYNPNLAVGGVLICLHDSRRRLAKAVADTIRAYFGELVYDTVIRTNVSLAEAPASGQTVFEYAPKSTGAEDYRSLVKEILKA